MLLTFAYIGCYHFQQHITVVERQLRDHYKREGGSHLKWKYSICVLLSIVALLSCGEDQNPIIEILIPDITRGPYLGDVTKTSIVVSWATGETSDSLVEYATDAQYTSGVYNQQAEGPKNVRRHSVTLTGLMPSTLYHYRVVSDSDASQDNTFHTAVEPSEPFTLVAYGDTRTMLHDHLAVVNRIIAHEPNLVISSGDMVTDGRFLPLWDGFFLITKNLMEDVPYYPALGNHENNSQFYYDLFHLPEGGGKENEQWYSFDYGNAHIVCLDSTVTESEEQLAWLENDLAQAAGEAQWIFVNFHHAVYSSGEHGSQISTMPEWIDAFERYGVDMVFNGHDHIYERSFSNGIWYIVTGGGGAPLRSTDDTVNPQQVYVESALHFCKLRIDGDQIDFEMIRVDGTVGDSMIITESVELASAIGGPLFD